MIDNLNLTELLGNPVANENQSKTRTKKLNPRLKTFDEEARKNLKLSKLSILEEDEEIQKEDKDDSDYEMDDIDGTGGEKKKRARKINNRAAKELRFGKINVNKYFTPFDKNLKPEENIFPNYNNIVIKPSKGGNIAYKICNVCFGFGHYTCPRCSDRYCSKECFKTHKEIKCVKYLEI
jgi:zinc finger HIT domain-containing protein 1